MLRSPIAHKLYWVAVSALWVFDYFLTLESEVILVSLERINRLSSRLDSIGKLRVEGKEVNEFVLPMLYHAFVTKWISLVFWFFILVSDDDLALGPMC